MQTDYSGNAAIIALEAPICSGGEGWVRDGGGGGGALISHPFSQVLMGRQGGQSAPFHLPREPLNCIPNGTPIPCLVRYV